MCRYYGCEANLMVSVCITLCRWTATARLSMPLNDRGISDYSNKCLKIANYWWQYNDHAHDLLTFTYMFLLKPTCYDIWFICNCILMAIILTWCLFICQVSSCPPLMGGRQSEFAISRSHAHIAIGSFRLHRMYTQLPILSIYVLVKSYVKLNYFIIEAKNYH
jgi:uncharacterized membrane protein